MRNDHKNRWTHVCGRIEIDQLWTEEAEKRFNEIKSGKVVTISLEEVFKEVKTRYNQ